MTATTTMAVAMAWAAAIFLMSICRWHWHCPFQRSCIRIWLARPKTAGRIRGQTTARRWQLLLACALRKIRWRCARRRGDSPAHDDKNAAQYRSNPDAPKFRRVRLGNDAIRRVYGHRRRSGRASGCFTRMQEEADRMFCCYLVRVRQHR